MAVKVFCSWCNQHEFRVDVNSVDAVGTLWLVCPECGRLTGVSDDYPRGLVIQPGPRREPAALPAQVVEEERAWLEAASRNAVFADLDRPEEDIYSLEDGKPFRDQG